VQLHGCFAKCGRSGRKKCLPQHRQQPFALGSDFWRGIIRVRPILCIPSAHRTPTLTSQCLIRVDP
jgi:hypothetical protein